jgi:predicted NAD/FAD-dependent oxidoreductase
MRAVALVDRGMGDGGHLETRRLGSGWWEKG